jgi:pyruvate/2-oxoglutarate dehydrogenase complex dihydrolipoamide acyltransferase (E2) component
MDLGAGRSVLQQPNDVMIAIQVMHKRAMDAGTLKSALQQKVEVQTASAAAEAAAQSGAEQPAQPAQQQVVVIQPAQPNTVYVPTYNPSTAHGAPVAQPAGYSGTEVAAAGVLGFGAGVLLGSLVNSGDNDWGCNWYGGNVVYNRNVWYSNSGFVPGRGYPGYRPGYQGYRPGFPAIVRATPVRCPMAAEVRSSPPTIQTSDLTSPSRRRFPTARELATERGSNLGANRPGNNPGGNFGGRRPGSNPGANRPGGGIGNNQPGPGLGGTRPGAILEATDQAAATISVEAIWQRIDLRSR